MKGDNVMDKTMINTDIRIFEFVMGFYEAKAEEDFKELCRSTYGENHNKEYRFELALCQWASDKAYRDFCRTIKFKEPDTDNARMKKRMEATGIICKKINGKLNLLMQAKIEPGNVNCVQISPTIQATKSNFTQVHGGKLPLTKITTNGTKMFVKKFKKNIKTSLTTPNTATTL